MSEVVWFCSFLMCFTLHFYLSFCDILDGWYPLCTLHFTSCSSLVMTESDDWLHITHLLEAHWISGNSSNRPHRKKAKKNPPGASTTTTTVTTVRQLIIKKRPIATRVEHLYRFFYTEWIRNIFQRMVLLCKEFFLQLIPNLKGYNGIHITSTTINGAYI